MSEKKSDQDSTNDPYEGLPYARQLKLLDKMLIGACVASMVFGVIEFTLRHRDLLGSWLYLFAFFAVAGPLLTLACQSILIHGRLWTGAFSRIATAVLVVVCAYGIVVILTHAEPYFQAGLNLIQTWPLRKTGTTVAILLGVLLFFFRLLSRFSYGICEIGFAWYVAWAKLPNIEIGAMAQQIPAASSTLNVSDLAIAVMTGSVYIIVRGLDNVQTGYKDLRPFKKATEAIPDNKPVIAVSSDSLP